MDEPCDVCGAIVFETVGTINHEGKFKKQVQCQVCKKITERNFTAEECRDFAGNG